MNELMTLLASVFFVAGAVVGGALMSGDAVLSGTAPFAIVGACITVAYVKAKLRADS